MQTFLIASSFEETARVLDRQRLGKQRVEAYQIITANIKYREGSKSSWQNHPAVKMWRGYEKGLALYGRTMCVEWKKRNYKDALEDFFVEIYSQSLQPNPLPDWLCDPVISEKVFASHRSNLLRKNPEHYSQFGWKEPSDLPYHWPVKEKVS
jgi:hypothetical protein